MGELKKGAILPIAERVHELINDPAIHAEASELAEKARRGKRTKEDVELNALVTLPIQYAVLEYMDSIGCLYRKPDAGIFQYDGILGTILVDVKARLEGKYWQQSEWEAWKLKQTKERVLYLCIDLTPSGEYVFRGCSWIDDLAPGNYGCPYVQTWKLLDFNLNMG